MKKQDIIFLILLLIVGLFLSFIIRQFLNWNIKNIFSYHLISLMIMGSLIYFSENFFRTIDTFLVVFFGAIINGIILNRTHLAVQIGGYFYIMIYSFFIFFIFAVIFHFIWFRLKIRYVKNLSFCVLEAFGYTLFHIVVLVILREAFNFNLIRNYFINSLLIMLTISMSFSIVEILYYSIEKIIKPPGSIMKNNDDED